jgi:hypothetical protein
MSEGPDFRVWATGLAGKAGNEPDSREFQRRMSIVEYWKRLADRRLGTRRLPPSFRG